MVVHTLELESADEVELAHTFELESPVVVEVAHRLVLESPDDVVLGLEGRIFQESMVVGCEGARLCCHQFSAPVELGRIGAGRTTSTSLGGGGRSGRKRPMMEAFTSSLRPHKSSPAPSSSKPSKAMALVR